MMVLYSAIFCFLGGLELFVDLLLRFPSNIHLLLEIAKVELILCK